MSDNSLSKPWPMQDGTLFGEAELFNHLADVVTPGITDPTQWAVQQHAAGDLSVNVAPGAAYVAIPGGGVRRVVKDTQSNSGAPGSPNTPGWESTFTTPDVTNPRIDRVVLKIYDDAIDGSGKFRAALAVVAGTPTPGATLVNLSGVASVPTNGILLANVHLGAGATLIASVDIDTSVHKIAVAGPIVVLPGTGAADGDGLAWSTSAGRWVASSIRKILASALSGFPNDATKTLLGDGTWGVAIPPAVMWDYAGAAGSVPAGWLLCDGTSYLRDTYPALFAIIGTTYGNVDSTHFNVPDKRGRVSTGVSPSGKAEVGALGNNDGLAQALRNITHVHSQINYMYLITGRPGGSLSGMNVPSAGDAQYRGLVWTGDVDNPNAPAYLVVNSIIKT